MLSHSEPMGFEDKFIFLIDNIINQLDENKSLLNFISKNLSWGLFMQALSTPSEQETVFRDEYLLLLKEAEHPIRDPELMLFMIVELVSATCYSAILYREPCSLDELKPELYRTIRGIIGQFSLTDEKKGKPGVQTKA